MKRPPDRRRIESPSRFNGSAVFRWIVFSLLAGFSLWPHPARAQFSQRDQNSARSISGLFIVHRTTVLSRLAVSPAVLADTNLVRLEPALLAISAERIKDSLWNRLDIPVNSLRRGQIYLLIHPARSLDESVTIVARRLAQSWDYHVELPDVLSQRRLARALTGVLLLEYANRSARTHSAEIPAWLTEGLSQELLAGDLSKLILSAPDKIVNGLPVTRLDQTDQGLDPLAHARRVLKNSSALNYAQLSWPTPAQLTGEDGGVYRASAQVFVNALLERKDGAARLRTMLELLPRFYNWQLAFQSAFRVDFPEPMDLEKWWALQVVSFAAHDGSSRWTPSASRERLDEILLVPVETRTASNSLPAHAEMSFQNAIRNLDITRQIAIFQSKLRDLELAQLRMAPVLAGLTDGYRRALLGYLGQHARVPLKSTVRATIKKLDVLDARRRAIESTLRPETRVQPSVAAVKLN